MGQGRGTPVHAYEVRPRKDHRGVSGPGNEFSITRNHGRPNDEYTKGLRQRLNGVQRQLENSVYRLRLRLADRVGGCLWGEVSPS